MNFSLSLFLFIYTHLQSNKIRENIFRYALINLIKKANRTKERKKPTTVPITIASPFPIHPPSFAEDLSGPQNSSFITFALSPSSSSSSSSKEGTKRWEKRESLFSSYMESCQFSLFPSILFALAMAPINYFTRHALYLDLSLFPLSRLEFVFSFFFPRDAFEKTVAGSGNNARFMRASVSFFCITCVYAYVYMCVCVYVLVVRCVYRFS